MNLKSVQFNTSEAFVKPAAGRKPWQTWSGLLLPLLLKRSSSFLCFWETKLFHQLLQTHSWRTSHFLQFPTAAGSKHKWRLWKSGITTTSVLRTDGFVFDRRLDETLQQLCASWNEGNMKYRRLHWQIFLSYWFYWISLMQVFLSGFYFSPPNEILLTAWIIHDCGCDIKWHTRINDSIYCKLPHWCKQEQGKLIIFYESISKNRGEYRSAAVLQHESFIFFDWKSIGFMWAPPSPLICSGSVKEALMTEPAYRLSTALEKVLKINKLIKYGLTQTCVVVFSFRLGLHSDGIS